MIIKVNVFGENSQLTRLVPDLSKVDPEDAFSSIPYEKGHSFLFYLELILGGKGNFSFLRIFSSFVPQLSNLTDVFNKYLRAHIDKFKGLSIDTNMWKSYLYEYFSDKVNAFFIKSEVKSQKVLDRKIYWIKSIGKHGYTAPGCRLAI